MIVSLVILVIAIFIIFLYGSKLSHKSIRIKLDEFVENQAARAKETTQIATLATDLNQSVQDDSTENDDLKLDTTDDTAIDDQHKSTESTKFNVSTVENEQTDVDDQSTEEPTTTDQQPPVEPPPPPPPTIESLYVTSQTMFWLVLLSNGPILSGFIRRSKFSSNPAEAGQIGVKTLITSIGGTYMAINGYFSFEFLVDLLVPKMCRFKLADYDLDLNKVMAAGIMIVYRYFPHWSVQNFFVIGLSMNAIQECYLDRFTNGVLLLGTGIAMDIMYTLTGYSSPKSTSPIVLAFPTIDGTDIFTTIDLSDLVLVGIVLAFFYRMDKNISQRSHFFRIAFLVVLTSIVIQKSAFTDIPLNWMIGGVLGVTIGLYAILTNRIKTLIEYRDYDIIESKLKAE